MCNQIRAEFYKVWRRRETYSVFGMMLALVVLVVCTFGFAQTQQANNPDEINIFFAMIVIPSMFMMGLYLLVWGIQIVFHDQYKHGTLKNEVSYGLSRTSIYLSRWVASLLVCAILLISILTVYILGNALALGLGTDAALMNTMGANMSVMMPQSFLYLGNSLLYAMPLWIGGMSLCLMFNFIFTNGNMSAIFYFCIVIGAESILNLVGDFVHPVFNTMASGTLTAPFAWLMSGGEFTPDVLIYPWLVGIGWTLISTVLGIVIFQRREIK